MAINSGVPLTGLPGMKDSLTRIVNQQATIENNASCFYSDVENAIELGASLALFSNAYKEDVVFPLLPTDGSGDLTFTRASTATRVNAEGLIETSPVNLLGYSEEFNNAYWTKNRSSITANSTSAPNGTTTADSLIEDTSTGTHEAITILSNETNFYNFSVYAKASTRTKIALVLAGNAWSSGGNGQVIFDLSNGTIVSSSGGATGGIESIGNGWYRCFIYKNAFASVSSAIPVVQLVDDSNNTSYAGNGTSGAFIWGAQLNIGATAKPYFPTTDRLNVPRIDYTGGGCGKLLLEKQSTNVLTQSNALTGVSGTTATVNNATSPDGTQNAILINGASGYAYAGTSNNFGGGVTSTFSAFIKYKQGIGQASIGIGGQFAAYLYIDGLDDGNIVLTNYAGSGVSGLTTGYEVHANGWYRFWLTATYTGTAGYQEWQISSNTTNTHLWYYGGQNEASSYMTSFIFTSGSSVTRLADSAFKTGISSLIGQTQGTLFFEYPNFNSDYNQGLIGIDDGSGNNRILFYSDSNNRITAQVRTNGVTQQPASYSVSGNVKVAIGYNSTDFVFYVNGTLRFTGTAVVFSNTMSALTFNHVGVGGSITNQAIVFPTRLTNTQLATLTTI